MSSNNRRRAERVAVGIPIQLATQCGRIDAQVRDLSRVGLRLRMAMDLLGGAPGIKPARIARAVSEFFAPRFSLDLHFRRLGSLVHRNAVLTRTGVPTDDLDAVEVCCEFERPLQDEEAQFLNLDRPLPPLRETVVAWTDLDRSRNEALGSVTFRPAADPQVSPSAPVDEAYDIPPSVVPRPRQRYRALVDGDRHDAPPTIFCHTDLITAIGVRVRISREDAWLAADASLQPYEVLKRLQKSFGSELQLRIIDNQRVDDVWSGPARISGVELPPESPQEILVTLAYGRPPSLSELRALSLVGSAA